MARNGSRPATATIATPLTDSDELSAPAASVPVSPVVRKWVIWILVSIAIVTGIGRIATIARSKGHEQTPLTVPVTANASLQPFSVTIPARERSRLIPPVENRNPEVRGFGKFSVVNVRADDDSECVVGEPGCVNGPALKGYYVRNDADVEITVTIVFKPD